MKHTRQNYTEFELRLIDLVKIATSITEEHAPYRYIRQLICSQGLEFYMYQPTRKGNYGDDDCWYPTLVEDCDGTDLGTINGELYWQLMREVNESKEKQAKSKFMKGSA